jgi:SAM-dependent methyltransferase
MLNSPYEYQKMAEVENHHWWYQVLHHKVYKVLVKKFQNNQNIAILDMGCGTGGLISYLNQKGYTNIKGFDFSQDAVNFCTQKKLPVVKGSLMDVDLMESEKQDVLICNDVLYFFDKKDLTNLFNKMSQKLKSNGILVINLPVLKCFSGIHDISIGNSENRFERNDIVSLIESTPFEIVTLHYWPFLLSPLIFLIRLKQRLSLKLNKNKTRVKSDIDMPSPFINLVLLWITSLENFLGKLRFFGSSQFIVLEKTNQK